MATLQKIRNKGVLLIVVVGLALLSFIIGDFLTNGSTFFNKSKEVVAKVNGDKINIGEYQALIDQVVTFQKFETGRTEVDEQTMQQIRAYVWDQYVREKLLLEETAKMGLTVTKEELSDRLIGNNIHPMIQQRRFFADQTGQFSRSLLVQFLNFKDEENEDPNMQQTLQDYRNLWMFLEKTVKFAILQEKYNVLLTKSIVANTAEAKFNYEMSLPVFNVNYVVQPYYSIPDTSVTVSDKEIKDLYKKQIKRFKQEPNATISYVIFNIEPQKEDFIEAETFINNLKDEFYTSADVAELVSSNSDIPYTGKNYTVNTVPASLKDFAFNGKTGDLYGPVFANNAYTMAKIMQSGISSPDSVKLRHIALMKSDEGKADSIIGAIKGGANFGELAKKYSAAKQTADNNGEIGWIIDGEQSLDKEITQNAFNKAANEIFTVSNAQGIQIFQIMEKTASRPKVKLAILERSVIASSKTESKIYNDAKRFAASLKNNSLDSAANKAGYRAIQASEIYEGTEQIQSIPQSRQIVRWIFENGTGDNSDVFECEKQLVVANIREMSDDEYRPVEKVTDQLRNELIRDKKAELIIKNLSGKISNDTTLTTLAASIGQTVNRATGVSFNAYQFGNAGFEPAVIGKTMNAKLNQVSAPVKGNAGVYVIAPVSISKNNNPFNAKAEKAALTSRTSYSLPNAVVMDMRNNADIEDNRLNFY